MGGQAQRIRLHDVEPMPWRNGGGCTRELMAWPDAKAWMLRFSVADIERDGPFSPYPGVLRDFCVLEGAGVLLTWADGREERMLEGRAPLRFDGGDAPDAQLINGPTRDLNLMLHEGMDARLLANDTSVQRRPWGCFVAEAGRLVIGTQNLTVPEATLVWFEPGVASAQCDARCWWIARSMDALA